MRTSDIENLLALRQVRQSPLPAVRAALNGKAPLTASSFPKFPRMQSRLQWQHINASLAHLFDLKDRPLQHPRSISRVPQTAHTQQYDTRLVLHRSHTQQTSRQVVTTYHNHAP